MIYNFYIFDRHCECVYYIEFQNRANFTASGGLKPGPTLDYFVWPESSHQTEQASVPYYLPPSFSEPDFIEKNKLVYGVVFSLKTFANKLAGPLEFRDGFLSFKSGSYKLHYFETLTGLRFILNTDPNCPNQKETLRHIFTNFYTGYILKDPLSTLSQPSQHNSQFSNQRSAGHEWGFNNQTFTQNLAKFLSELPYFN